MSWWENFTSGVQNLAQGATPVIDALQGNNKTQTAVAKAVEPKRDYTPLYIGGAIVAALVVVVLLFKR